MNIFLKFVDIFIGAFGEVRLCTHRKTGAKRAVKIIKKSFLQGKEETRFLQEIEILKNMVRFSNYSYLCRIIQIL
jgi:serine/threonine protein kinase